jgi:hypothetical protein
MIPPLDLPWLPWPFADALAIIILYVLAMAVSEVLESLGVVMAKLPPEAKQAMIMLILMGVVAVIMELTK